MSTPPRPDGFHIPFGDLARNVRRLRPEIETALGRVLDRGQFVLGPELAAFEAELARFIGCREAVGVGNGTDAIALALQAAGIHQGDEVITPAVSAAFTGLAIAQAGARPVFVDVDPDTLLIDLEATAAAITPRTRALVPVHLYGRAADIAGLRALAEAHDLRVIEDAAQAIGVAPSGRGLAQIADAVALSFYPTKNLGAYGDAGAVATNDETIARRLRELRDGGQTSKYRHDALGVNSRLDEIQAAILRVKLGHVAQDTARRRAIAAAYREAIRDAPEITPPPPAAPDEHAYHLFVVQHPARDALAAALGAAGIGTAVHYPMPIPRQNAFRPFSGSGAWPRADAACARVLSLPIYPELTDDEVAAVATALKELEPVAP